jgi:S-adenosyl-L-methionine hydrolase (adenosine-forming)
MPRRYITLTTDFGSVDPFVGVMKGVILSVAPAASIVDLTHEITPFDIPEAGFSIYQAARYFPPRTIHVVVVDPGVGSSRRPILVESGRQYFIGPDNGVFSMILSSGSFRAREITNDKFFLKPVSATFHGRDIFAPAAAWLARGTPVSKFGKQIEDALRSSYDKPVRTAKRAWTGAVLKVDRFGNLVTNFHIDEFAWVKDRPFTLEIGLRNVNRLVRTYADAPPGEPVIVVGSSGFLEVATNQGSAARSLGCASGAPAELTIY